MDAESYDEKTPSRYNIAAIEESELLLWTKADFDRLTRRILGWEPHGADLIEDMRLNYF